MSEGTVVLASWTRQAPRPDRGGDRPRFGGLTARWCLHQTARMRRSFGGRLRALREAQGLTRRSLEDATGISQRQIGYLENDQKEPRLETLQALAKALGPEVILAAFPKIALASRNSATARYASPAEWPIVGSPDGLPLTAAVG